METKKIGIACFIGGAIGFITALLVAPAFWLLGLLAGIAAGFLTGYIAYDVREIIQKIPRAWRNAKANTFNAFSSTTAAFEKFFRFKLPKFGRWIVKTRPLIYYSLLLTSLLMIAGRIFIANFFQELINWSIPSMIVLASLFIFNLNILNMFYLCGENSIRRKVDKLYKATYITIDMMSGDIICRKEGNIVFFPLTYRFFAQGILFGIINIFKFFFWLAPKYLGIGIGYLIYGIAMAIYFIGKFIWHIFKFIHSDKRVLCGVDSAIGMAISFVCFRQPDLTFGTVVMLAIFSGILGAVIGIANYELVSKWLLRRYLPHIS